MEMTRQDAIAMSEDNQRKKELVEIAVQHTISQMNSSGSFQYAPEPKLVHPGALWTRASYADQTHRICVQVDLELRNKSDYHTYSCDVTITDQDEVIGSSIARKLPRV